MKRLNFCFVNRMYFKLTTQKFQSLLIPCANFFTANSYENTTLLSYSKKP